MKEARDREPINIKRAFGGAKRSIRFLPERLNDETTDDLSIDQTKHRRRYRTNKAQDSKKRATLYDRTGIWTR